MRRLLASIFRQMAELFSPSDSFLASGEQIHAVSHAPFAEVPCIGGLRVSYTTPAYIGLPRVRLPATPTNSRRSRRRAPSAARRTTGRVERNTIEYRAGHNGWALTAGHVAIPPHYSSLVFLQAWLNHESLFIRDKRSHVYVSFSHLLLAFPCWELCRTL